MCYRERPVTGIFHFYNKTPVIWYCKKQSTPETATYGAVFVSERTCVEQIVDHRKSLRDLGVPSNDNICCIFGDNEWVNDQQLHCTIILNARLWRNGTTSCRIILYKVWLHADKLAWIIYVPNSTHRMYYVSIRVTRIPTNCSWSRSFIILEMLIPSLITMLWDSTRISMILWNTLSCIWSMRCGSTIMWVSTQWWCGKFMPTIHNVLHLWGEDFYFYVGAAPS